MSLHRRAAKRDANERAIIDALIGAGATVQQLSAKGVPDLLVGYCGVNFLLEIKMLKGKLTKDESEWHERWEGQVFVVDSVEKALAILDERYKEWAGHYA